MRATEKKVVMYDSPEAATIQTVTGWVSSSGHFWGNDEHMARFDGSTHRKCAKKPDDHRIHETRGYCNACHSERRLAAFLALPQVAWDFTTPVVLHDTDEYFFDPESLRDYMLDNDISVEDVRLVICKPNMARQIDGSEWADDLPEDGDIPAELHDAIDALNEVIAKLPPLSWAEGKVAATLPADFLDDAPSWQALEAPAAQGLDK